ncbi:MAG: peptide ABC transporter substrate-binding protein [Chlamydiales bacterium]
MTCPQVLHINHQGNYTSAHPHTGVDFGCRNLQKALFEGLTRHNSEGLPELAGAENVEVSPDKTQYIFTLRPMLWTNGKTVTAFDFERSWKEAISPQSNCLRPDLFYPIKNAKRAKIKEVSIDDVGIKAIDDRTLVVDLEHPTPYFLDLTANAVFYPLYDKSEEPTVFNGPFFLKKWNFSQNIILKKNPKYWDAENVKLEEIDISLVSDPNTAILMYEKGEIDWVGHPFTWLPLDTIKKMSESQEFNSQPIAGVYWITLNNDTFPLSSAKIRRALSAAIDRNLIAEHVALGEIVTNTPIPTYLSLVNPNETYLGDFNVEYAKQLFEEGLNELNLSRKDFPTLLYRYSEVPGQKKLVEAIQEQWEKVLGIQVELIPSEWNVFLASLIDGEYEVGGYITFNMVNDPMYILEFFEHKESTYNMPNWENSHYQKLLALARAETNPEIRNQHLKEAEKMLIEENVVIPLYMVYAKYLKSSKIRNLTVNNLGQTDLKSAYIETN